MIIFSKKTSVRIHTDNGKFFVTAYRDMVSGRISVEYNGLTLHLPFPVVTAHYVKQLSAIFGISLKETKQFLKGLE